MNAPPLRAVLFDHDGTLVDSEPIHLMIWQQVLVRHGVELTDDDYRHRYAGVPTRSNAIDLVRRFSLAVDPEALAGEKNDATRRYLAAQAFPLLPGVEAAITTFGAHGLRQAIVTGAAGVAVQATLRAHAFAAHIETVVCGDDVQRSKPAPECYLLALERLGLAPGECVAVEDTGPGVAAATAAGIACVAIPNALSHSHDFGPAAVVLSDMHAAVTYVLARSGGTRPGRQGAAGLDVHR